MPSVFKKHHAGEFDDPDGFIFKITKSPIFFRRNTVYTFSDVTKWTTFVANIPTCHVGNRRTAPFELEPSIIDYLLCRHKLPDLMIEFGFEPDDAVFVNAEFYNIRFIENHFYYFLLEDCDTPERSVYLRVNKEAMDSSFVLRNIVASIVKTLNSRHAVVLDLQSSSELIFTVIIGKMLYPLHDEHPRISLLTAHMNTMAYHTLTDDTKFVMNAHGVIIHNAFDLLKYVFPRIDGIIGELTTVR